MSDNLSHKPSTFIHVVGKDIHDNLLRLDQKLKGLAVEIQVKIEASADEEDQLTIKRKAQLTHLADEVTKAITSIKKLVDMVIPNELSATEFAQINHEELEAFQAMLEENTQKIIKIKEEF